MPAQKRERYKENYGLKESDIEIYIREPEWGEFFENTAAILNDIELARLTSNYITSDLKTIIPAESLADIIRMVSVGEVSSRGAKDILKIIQTEGGSPKTIAEEKKFIQISDKKILKQYTEEVLKEHPYAPIQFQVGQAMKKSGGRANPVILQELLKRKGK